MGSMSPLSLLSERRGDSERERERERERELLACVSPRSLDMGSVVATDACGKGCMPFF